jgi:hypothetical protein
MGAAASVAASVAQAHAAQTRNRIEDPIVLRCTPSLVRDNAFITHISHACDTQNTVCMTALQTFFRPRQRNRNQNGLIQCVCSVRSIISVSCAALHQFETHLLYLEQWRVRKRQKMKRASLAAVGPTRVARAIVDFHGAFAGSLGGKVKAAQPVDTG